MPETSAILLYRDGADLPWDRQYLACVPYLVTKGYRVASIAQDDADAVALVRLKRARVVVAAVAGPDDDVLRMLLKDAGGTLEYCRLPRLPRQRPSRAEADEMVARMFEAGLTTDQIVTITQRPRSRVRAILDRLRGR